ncbi:MAG: hypothetical protein J5679_01065 [Alphaproteobacteria bacterium]|nr:hypothetical protein [Alphaproteobacteria bacterium]
MKRREIAGLAKNAVSTVFLLAGAFFVCSTFLSMRAVFADPIAPTVTSAVNANTASPRANATSRASGRNGNALRVRDASPVVTRSNNTATARNVVSRAGSVSRSNTATSRGVVSRNVAQRGNVSRNVVARTTQPQTQSRISHTGAAIRGSYASSSAATTYTYLSNKLYSGNYSNIIDSTTGLISAEAYQACLESYYTCMDEICTARSAAKRRCSCAARVTNFIDAEEKLKVANEELIKASGELALLIANKGKDVSEAFQLTDAEKVMNCVSWQEEKAKASADSTSKDSVMKTWCENHGIYDTESCGYTTSPKYCKKSGNNFGFDISNIEGSSSDILATLQAWADAKDNSLSYIRDDNENLLTSYNTAYSDVVSAFSKMSGISYNDSANLDKLANTWGYELFGYAHNNVCGRVLDACFNGIYEGCGTPPANGRCASGEGTSTSCPFNYNSKIDIDNTGDVELYERKASTVSTATCFGYSTTTTTNGVTTTTDPYASLRGPVADARRSVMQKYLLDANADCDTYGEELKATAQNVSYQKAAAQQALQQKRLEFKNEELAEIRTRALDAANNFKECMDEIADCYATQLSSHGPKSSTTTTWTASRIRTYCVQMSNAPHCYEEMICNPSTAQYLAVIDYADSTKCYNSQDYTKNSCRNVVTLSEMLNSVTGAGNMSQVTTISYDDNASGDNATTCTAGTLCTGSGNSAQIREKCLLDNGVDAIRNWKKEVYDAEACKVRNGTWDEALSTCSDEVSNETGDESSNG